MSYGNDKPIKIWTYDWYVDIINKAIEEYQNMDSSVTFEVIKKEYGEIEYNLSIALEAHQELPNLIFVDDQEIKKYVEKFPGLFTTLNEYIDKSSIIEARAQNITIRENVYACPCSNCQVALYYRRDMLRSCKDFEELPTDLTWEDYINLGIELKEKGDSYFLPSVNFFSNILMQSTGNLYYNQSGVIKKEQIAEILTITKKLSENELTDILDISDINYILDLISNDQLFSVIGTPSLFTKIKELVENNNLSQEWAVAKLPKDDVLCYDVNLGGASLMMINNESVDEQNYVYNFLTEIFTSDNDASHLFYKEAAENYDMVPSIVYLEDQLTDLTNNGCFGNQQVINFLYNLSKEVPPIYYGKYTNELNGKFQGIVTQVISDSLSIENGAQQFEQICEEYFEIDPPPVLDHIEIEVPPTKLSYYSYEPFDNSDMVVRAYYVDGTDSIVTGYIVFPSIVTPSDTYVTISYTSGGVTKTADQDITVIPRRVLSIEAKSNKEIYLHTTTLTKNDFKVYATFDEGEDAYIMDYDISPEVLENIGNQQVIITYVDNGQNITTSTNITVEKKLTGIQITKNPNKLNYIEEQYFDTTGMVVSADYSDGIQEEIKGYEYTPTGALKYIPPLDAQELEITYEENKVAATTTTLIFVVEKKLESIEIEYMKENEFISGEFIPRESITVRAYYDNDTSKKIEDFDMLFGEKEENAPLVESDTELTVSYEENGVKKSASYPIIVHLKKLTGLKIIRKPSNLLYENASESNLDLSGLVLSMQFNDKLWADFDYDMYIENSTSKNINNQNLIDGGNLDFTVSDKDSNNKKIVTIQYKESNNLESTFFECTFVVYDIGSNLQTLFVMTQPSKRKYYVGETFDKTGLQVYGNFVKLEGKEEIFYSDEVTTKCYIQDTLIKPNDRYVHIYYENDSERLTNHTRVAITVNERNVDNSKQGQTELTYSCDSGQAKVNLFNQRMLFEHLDVSIGINSYTIACSHIYNSQFNEEKALRFGRNSDSYYKTNMGKGFKLSIQQYLLYDETYERYIYIDGLGYRHYFVSLGDNARYYDTTGTNLLLEQIEDTYVIYDMSGNKMYFKDGVIIKSQSCFDESYAKIYIYDAFQRLVEVYDNRDTANKIKFIYDEETSLLSSIKCVNESSDGETIAQEVNYSYKIKIGKAYLEKITNKDITTVFAYDEKSNLIYTYDLSTKSCLKFEYCDSLIQEITNGIFDSNYQNIPINQIIQKNVITSDDGGYKITVRNQRKASQDNSTDVVIEYHLNASGYTVAVLEENLGKQAELKTLEKEPGIGIDFPDSNTSSFTINTKNEYIYNHGMMCYSTKDSHMLDALTEYRLKKYKKCDTFAVKFWAKLKYVLNDPKVSVTIQSKSGIKKSYFNTGTSTLDNSAIGVWQLVTVPVRISGNRIKEVTISMETNYWQGFDICDVMLYPSSQSSLIVPSSISFLFDMLNIDSFNKIVYTLADTNAKIEQSIDDEHFITQNDLKYTVLNMYQTVLQKSSNEEGTIDSNNVDFILSMCDGTKKQWVKNASLALDTIEVPIQLKKETNRYIFPYYYRGSSPDGETEFKNKLFIYPATTIGSFIGPIIKSITYVSTSSDSEYSIETDADFFGRILRESDEYAVTTIYEYNSFGEVIKKTLSHSDTIETIVFTTTNTTTSTTQEMPTSHTQTIYNSPLGSIYQTLYNGKDENSANVFTQTFEYNDCKTRLEKVSDNLIGKNVLTYTNNRLSTITPTDPLTDDDIYGYRIEYDRYGNPYKYSLLSGTSQTEQLLTEHIINYQEGTIVNKQYRVSPTESDDVEIILDKYGKAALITEKSNGSATKKTIFTYQTLKESNKTAQVKSFKDPYEEREYTYHYDEYNTCTGYEATSGMGDFSVEKTGPTEDTYFKGTSDSRECSILYDDRIMSPRIEQTYNYGNCYNYVSSSSYQYDCLGRINKKTITENSTNQVNITNTYLSGTPLKNSIEIKLFEDYEKEYKFYKYGYDERGRITTIKETIQKEKKEEIEDPKVQSFTYDIANRLTSETKTTGEVITYEYNVDGTIKSEQTNNGEKVNYLYEKGRLTKKGDKSYSYDNIGNCILYDEKPLLWHRGNLLKQFDTTTYSYDNQGIRFKKETGNHTTIFLHDGGKIIDELRISPYKRGTTTDRISYIYDAEGICGFWFWGINFIYIKDGLGNVRSIVTNASSEQNETTALKEVASYDYDAWGNCTINPVPDGIVSGVNIAEFNKIRWKSMYFDSESGLYYINGRYYSPYLGRFIQPAEVFSLDPLSVNGLNLYSYANNNLIEFSYGSYSSSEMSSIFVNPSFLFNIVRTIFPNNSGIYWKSEWFSTNGPHFLVSSPTKKVLVEWGLSIHKKSLFFDEKEQQSIYIGLGNGSAFAGYNIEKDIYGIFLNANVSTIGYDGRYIDIGVSVIGIGVIFGWENKKLRLKVDPPGWFGFDISIDFGQIFKDLFGWEW